MDSTQGAYNAPDRVLVQHGAPYQPSTLAAQIPELNTSSWYKPQLGCLRWDQTRVATRHSFPDAPIPRGKPLDPGAAGRVCGLIYGNPWPMEAVAGADMVDTEMNHPQFAFQAAYGPATRYQIEVESELRTLNVPLGKCQPVYPMDAPLFRNEVAPPLVKCLDPRVQNACNPIAVIVGPRGDGCRVDADAVTTSMSGRWLNNPTRQDTMRMDLPFAPPGIGSGAPRGVTAPLPNEPYFTNAPQRLAKPPPPAVPAYAGGRSVVYPGGQTVQY
jgi:hypothetical protein